MTPKPNALQKTTDGAYESDNHAENDALRPPRFLFSWLTKVSCREPHNTRAISCYVTDASICMFLYKRSTVRLLPTKSQNSTAGEEKKCDEPNNRSSRDHVCKTPGLNFATSGFSAQASS